MSLSSAQVLRDRRLDLPAGNGSNNTPLFDAVLEENEQRNAHGAVLRRRAAILIDVELGEADVRARRSELLENAAQKSTTNAPLRMVSAKFASVRSMGWPFDCSGVLHFPQTALRPLPTGGTRLA
jgi:hypothetical protein